MDKVNISRLNYLKNKIGIIGFSDHTCCTVHRKLEQVAAEGSWQILAMDNDQYDIEYDDDCVPRVDYIDRERDRRLARYAAAAHRTPGNEGFQTQAHTGPCSSRKVSDIASTSGGIGYTNGTLLPPLGTFWTHEELTARCVNARNPREKRPRPPVSPARRGWVPKGVMIS